jgi:hypothetical protein
MDPYILPYIHELYDLAELTGETEWAETGTGRLGAGQPLVFRTEPFTLGGLSCRAVHRMKRLTLGRPYEDQPFEWMPTWMPVYRIDNLCRTMMPGGDRPGRVL